MSFIRLKNRILQAFYRPIVPQRSISFFDEVEKNIEERITPLLSELFD